MDQSEFSRQVTIWNLTAMTRAEDVKWLASNIGPVERICMITKDRNETVGIVFVVFQREEDALRACKFFNHYFLNGVELYAKVGAVNEKLVWPEKKYFEQHFTDDSAVPTYRNFDTVN